MIITTSTRVTPELEEEAREIAESYQLDYVERKKRSMARLHESYGDILLLSKENLSLEYKDGQRLIFHPDTAMLRIKAPRDPLLELLGAQPLTVLDTTMGLASDSIVMSSAGHEVLALESQVLIHLIVSRGLQHFFTGNDRVDQAMRRIETKCMESLAFLKTCNDKSIDVIYCDPMFSEMITESNNLDGLKPMANHSPLTREFMVEAKRVAQYAIILKSHYRDKTMEKFGFTRFVRPYQKFHFGKIELHKN